MRGWAHDAPLRSGMWRWENGGRWDDFARIAWRQGDAVRWAREYDMKWLCADEPFAMR